VLAYGYIQQEYFVLCLPPVTVRPKRKFSKPCLLINCFRNSELLSVTATLSHLCPKLATRGEIFSQKFTKYRSAAGLRPDPLGELKRSPDLLAAIRGPTSKRRGREGKERKPLLAGPLFKSRLRL